MLYDGFTHQYEVVKMLGFSLEPEGRTDTTLKEDGVIEAGEELSKMLDTAKDILSKYHRRVLSEALQGLKLNGLEEYRRLFDIKKKTREDWSALKKAELDLAGQIADHLRKHPKLTGPSGKEPLQASNIVAGAKEDDYLTGEEKVLMLDLEPFRGYLKQYSEQKMFAYEGVTKQGTVAGRLISDNLPVYIKNIDLYEQISAIPEIKQGIKELSANIGDLLSTMSVDEYFSLESYPAFAPQSAIDAYNTLIGGYSTETGKVKGLNEYINEYRQTHKDVRLPLFKKLKKQIYSETGTLSFIPAAIESDNELLDLLNGYWEDSKDSIEDSCKLLSTIYGYDTEKIYIDKRSLNTFSNKAFGSWYAIEDAIMELKAKDELRKAYTAARKKKKNSNFFISIAQINNLMTEKGKDLATHYFLSEDIKELKVKVALSHKALKSQLQLRKDNEPLRTDKKTVSAIKTFLDAVKEYEWMFRYLKADPSLDRDELFYNTYDTCYDTISAVDPVYNRIRNYLTKKPYSTKKLHITFGNPELLGHFDMNKQKENGAVILRRDGFYYLAILKDGYEKEVINAPIAKDGEEAYEKFEFKNIPDTKSISAPIFRKNKGFSAKNEALFAPKDKAEREDILRIRNTKSYDVNSSVYSKADLVKFIDFYKSCIEKYDNWKYYSFTFKDSKDYSSMNEFWDDMARQAFYMRSINIPAAYIDTLVEDGKLYLFKMMRKDYKEEAKGKKDLQTLYWESLFSPENIKNTQTFILNGGEFFFRKASLPRKVTHHKGDRKIFKNPVNAGREEYFKFDIIKDRRYTEDKMSLHIGVYLNKGKKTDSGNTDTDISPKAIDAIKASDDVYVIGLNRGERNLISYSVIDKNNNIVEQGTLNKISSGDYEYDYNDALSRREAERNAEQRSWDSQKKIKDLKNGYVGQAVHAVAELMMKYPGIVVLEDLNASFKQSRQKIDKNIYQNFETALIKKLNYLVTDKNGAEGAAGSASKAYQLTSGFTELKYVSKQTGFLFFLPPTYISRTDPVTGFVSLFDTRFKNKKETQKFISCFDSICLDRLTGNYKFSFDYSQFGLDDKADGSKTNWDIYTHGTRIRQYIDTKKGKWTHEEVDLTEEFTKLFKDSGIDPVPETNIKEELTKDRFTAEFYRQFMKLFSLTVQISNTIPNEETDYILSCVKDKNGSFFDSRRGNTSLPLNTDLNAAYNMA
ncbi:MAG: type V CRISPR-associated protein Cas12a/Cpf1, partial [Lachnospiraceae bacterium]|nr:type V CRISPR-associated protein Cas12a/Cpf1 [Lachnospiraceae bacterium]